MGGFGGGHGGGGGGGFGGGHGGGGGFGGGHSSGGFGGGHHSGGPHGPMGPGPRGPRPRPYGAFWGPRWFYYGPGYGVSFGSFLFSRILSIIIFLFLGVGMLVGGVASIASNAGYKEVTATITEVWKEQDNFDGSYYEEYKFTYTYKDTLYEGEGDDDLKWDGSYKINVGETYTLYAKGEKYSFDKPTVTPGVILIAIGSVCTLILCYAAGQVVRSCRNRETQSE